MTKDEALKLALEALEDYKYAEARTIIREALAQPEQKPVAWPKTPAEISDMIGSSYVWREHKISDVEPHESDKYCVTAHDLLEAFENWNEYTNSPQRKPLTDEELRKLADKHLFYQPEGYEVSGVFALARAIEAAHGIKGEA